MGDAHAALDAEGGHQTRAHRKAHGVRNRHGSGLRRRERAWPDDGEVPLQHAEPHGEPTQRTPAGKAQALDAAAKAPDERLRREQSARLRQAGGGARQDQGRKHQQQGRRNGNVQEPRQGIRKEAQHRQQPAPDGKAPPPARALAERPRNLERLSSHVPADVVLIYVRLRVALRVGLRLALRVGLRRPAPSVPHGRKRRRRPWCHRSRAQEKDNGFSPQELCAASHFQAQRRAARTAPGVPAPSRIDP
nr:hypothetical protein [uncultured Thiohalocapsa sp.]